MFISLNKKFIYTIVSFFIITALIFLYSFYLIYDLRFQNELKSNIIRNQEYINLLYENNVLKKELMHLSQKTPEIKILSEKSSPNNQNIEKTISIEEKRIMQMQKSYEDRYSSLFEGIKIIEASSILIILALILLCILIKRWVISPLELLANVSKEVASGNLSQRASVKQKRYFLDETDFLIDTFNTMLDKLEKNIYEIKEAEIFLQKIIDGIPDGLCVIDSEYNIIISNKAYRQQTGTQKKELSKCYIAAQKRLSPCNTATNNCPISEICYKNKKHVHVVQQFAHNNNKHLYINAAPLQIKDKTLIIEVIRDLSNDIKFSHQQKLSSLGFMATSVAHEMKNHLGAIRMIVERLIEKENFKTSEQKDLLQLILQQIIESINVPERLLKLSQISEDDKQKIDCYENIKEVVSIMDYEAKSKGMSIQINKHDHITLIGNENDFKMVIINLLSNAIKAGKANGEISINLLKEKNNNIIKVQDNGCGIAEHILPHIFEPFYSNGKEGKMGGTGLGLAIVKSIIEKLKGSISVESKIGVGTCFSLKFPIINKK